MSHRYERNLTWIINESCLIEMRDISLEQVTRQADTAHFPLQLFFVQHLMPLSTSYFSANQLFSTVWHVFTQLCDTFLLPFSFCTNQPFSTICIRAYQWYRRVQWKPCNFLGNKVARFLMSSKDAPQKMQFLGTIKKLASLFPRLQNAKWQKTPTESAVIEPKYVRIPMSLHIFRALEQWQICI